MYRQTEESCEWELSLQFTLMNKSIGTDQISL